MLAQVRQVEMLQEQAALYAQAVRQLQADVAARAAARSGAPAEGSKLSGDAGVHSTHCLDTSVILALHAAPRGWEANLPGSSHSCQGGAACCTTDVHAPSQGRPCAR